MKDAIIAECYTACQPIDSLDQRIVELIQQQRPDRAELGVGTDDRAIVSVNARFLKSCRTPK